MEKAMLVIVDGKNWTAYYPVTAKECPKWASPDAWSDSPVTETGTKTPPSSDIVINISKIGYINRSMQPTLVLNNPKDGEIIKRVMLDEFVEFWVESGGVVVPPRAAKFSIFLTSLKEYLENVALNVVGTALTALLGICLIVPAFIVAVATLITMQYIVVQFLL